MPQSQKHFLLSTYVGTKVHLFESENNRLIGVLGGRQTARAHGKTIIS